VTYWEEMAMSSYQKIFPHSRVTYHVFTDQPERITQFAKDKSINQIRIYKINSLGWPAATLERYKIYLMHSSELKDEFLMHLDADMLVRDSAEFIFEDLTWGNGMVLVSHPGFFRPSNKLQLIKIYLRDPALFIRDVYRNIRFGGIGAWETNPKSKAFVARKDRSAYVCGGTWLGTRGAFLELVESLAKQVDYDLRNNLIAKWHDESHLNAWSANNVCRIIGPALCHDERYSYLKSIRPIITAVDKNAL